LAEATDSAVFYHTVQTLRRHYFPTDGFSNGFAQWVFRVHFPCCAAVPVLALAFWRSFSADRFLAGEIFHAWNFSSIRRIHAPISYVRHNPLPRSSPIAAANIPGHGHRGCGRRSQRWSAFGGRTSSTALPLWKARRLTWPGAMRVPARRRQPRPLRTVQHCMNFSIMNPAKDARVFDLRGSRGK